MRVSFVRKNKQTNRQTDKQTDRQTDKQTNRHTDKPLRFKLGGDNKPLGPASPGLAANIRIKSVWWQRNAAT